MNLLAMRTKLRKRIGNPDTTDVPDVDLDGHINSAYRDVVSRFRFHKGRKLCVFETVAGTSRYGIPTDCEAVYRLRDQTTGRKLEKADDHDESQLEGLDDEVEGIPLKYIRQRDWVKLTPTPDGIYLIEMFYKVGATDLAGDSATPVVPESWHEGIIKLARHYFYDETGDVPKAQYALANYSSWLSTKSIEVDEEKRDLDKGVRIPHLAGANRSRRRDFDEE